MFSLYFYLDDSSLVGSDNVGQLIFDFIQIFHFSYYHSHKLHFTSYKPADGVIVLYNFLSCTIPFFLYAKSFYVTAHWNV